MLPFYSFRQYKIIPLLVCRHAVRRFVQENQGLMRRMYGDENYINILKAEFDKNDIELKYDDYHHHFMDELRYFVAPLLRFTSLYPCKLS